MHADSAYDLQMTRLDDHGELTFKHPAVPVAAGATESLAFSTWARQGDSIPLTINGNRQDLPDQG